LQYKVGDLVVLMETVEWDDLIGIKGEICLVADIYDRTNVDDGVFFDYKICTADGICIDVWQGEIKKLEDVEEV
tara:strand:+ start:386 stop:607 length:222 start_codon:yes stop_codon:yes gene_type:complete